MKIVVMGAGAVGSLFGGLLAAEGADVHLISRRKPHIRAIREGGLTIEGASGSTTVRVPAYVDASDVGRSDLVLLTVKAYDTKGALEDAEPLVDEETYVMSLQNGVGNLRKVTETVGEERALAGVTSHGSTLTSSGRVEHTGEGITLVGGVSRTARAEARRVVDLFERSSIESEYVSDVQAAIWRKALANVAINPVGALTDLRNGELIENPGIRWVMERAVQEGLAVCREAGIEVGRGVVEEAFEVARRTARNFSSMHQDLSRGKRTEIDSLNGKVVELGEELGVEVPVNRALTELIRAKQGNVG